MQLFTDGILSLKRQILLYGLGSAWVELLLLVDAVFHSCTGHILKLWDVHINRVANHDSFIIG